MIEIKPGDTIAIHYPNPNFIQRAISWSEDSPAEHIVCCVGGLDIIEATVMGVKPGSMSDYVGCDLYIRRLPEKLILKPGAAVDYWKLAVGESYGYKQIVGLALASLLYKLGDHAAMSHVPSFFKDKSSPICSELADRGLRAESLGYDLFLLKLPFEVTPADFVDSLRLVHVGNIKNFKLGDISFS